MASLRGMLLMADADVAALGEFHGHATLLGGQEAAVLRVQLQVAEQQRQRDVADERQRLSAQLAQERWGIYEDIGRCGEI